MHTAAAFLNGSNHDHEHIVALTTDNTPLSFPHTSQTDHNMLTPPLLTIDINALSKASQSFASIGTQNPNGHLNDHCNGNARLLLHSQYTTNSNCTQLSNTNLVNLHAKPETEHQDKMHQAIETDSMQTTTEMMRMMMTVTQMTDRSNSVHCTMCDTCMVYMLSSTTPYNPNLVPTQTPLSPSNSFPGTVQYNVPSPTCCSPELALIQSNLPDTNNLPPIWLLYVTTDWTSASVQPNNSNIIPAQWIQEKFAPIFCALDNLAAILDEVTTYIDALPTSKLHPSTNPSISPKQEPIYWYNIQSQSPQLTNVGHFLSLSSFSGQLWVPKHLDPNASHQQPTTKPCQPTDLPAPSTHYSSAACQTQKPHFPSCPPSNFSSISSPTMFVCHNNKHP